MSTPSASSRAIYVSSCNDRRPFRPLKKNELLLVPPLDHQHPSGSRSSCGSYTIPTALSSHFSRLGRHYGRTHLCWRHRASSASTNLHAVPTACRFVHVRVVYLSCVTSRSRTPSALSTPARTRVDSAGCVGTSTALFRCISGHRPSRPLKP